MRDATQRAHPAGRLREVLRPHGATASTSSSSTPDATKIDVRHAVEQAFNVRVDKVNTLNRKGKTRRNRKNNTVGQRPDTKRAIVTLHEGDRIDLFEKAEGPTMPLRKRKPTSAGRRFQIGLGLLRDHPVAAREVPRSRPKPRTGGRNSYGRKTARHRGGGHKQQYRIIDFKRDKDGVPAKVAAIEYDPNRNARIALLHYLRRREALHPGPGAGAAWATCCRAARARRSVPGNALPLRYIPVGSTVHNVELRPGGGGKLARGAGMSVQLVAKEGAFATLRLPSTEMRRVPIDCRATLGEVGNAEAELINDRARPAATGGRACGPRPGAWP